MTELKIVDIREIVKVIKNVYDYDFSQFAITSFKQRIEKLMIRNNISNVDNLKNKLENQPEFFDNFLFEISIPSTEMFRDPSLWRWLREDFLQEAIEKSIGRYRIWLPNCVSGGELYSLVILLQELNLLQKVEIIATSISNKSIEFIKEGRYDLKKIVISAENYKRFHGPEDFTKYYTLDRYYAFRDPLLIKNVEFRKQNINFDESPQNVKLIFFRNNIINYNPNLQETVLQHMFNCLSATGHLIIGTKERINLSVKEREFELFNESESVYRKKIKRN